MESPGQSGPYMEMLQAMLDQLHGQLDQLVRPLAAGHEEESLDQYLLDLNNYYYQSFHHHFMPQYRQAVEDDLRRIHKLSRQEQALQSDLFGLLRFCMKVYNRNRIAALKVQHLSSRISLRLQALESGSETRTVDLLYLLKEHVEAWTRFTRHVDVARSLKADKPLLDTLERFPACSLAASLFRAASFGDGRDRRDFNRLLAQWQLGLRVLARLQENKGLQASLLDELEQVDASWDNRKAVPAMRSWYKRHVQPGYQLYLETLRACSNRPDQRRLARTADQFREWLQAWLNTLEYCCGLQTRGWGLWLDWLPALPSLDERLCLELADYGLRGRRSLDELISGLTASHTGSYDAFSQSSRQILSRASGWLQDISDSRPGLLAPLQLPVRELRAEVESMLRAVELLDERETRAGESISAYQQLQSVLDEERGVLDSFGTRLEQMLEARHLEDRFQELAPEIEHVRVRTGGTLPPAWAARADGGLISTQPSEAPEGTILYTEGDIFIIRLGELVHEEIPKIVVAGKG